MTFFSYLYQKNYHKLVAPIIGTYKSFCTRFGLMFGMHALISKITNYPQKAQIAQSKKKFTSMQSIEEN